MNLKIGSIIKRLRSENDVTQEALANVLIVAHGMASRTINRRINRLEFGEANKFLLANCDYIKYEI